MVFQANPLNHKQPDIHLMGGSRGMLAAKQPLVVPMLLRLSHFRLSSYVVLVVSKQKGITLVFKTDPLQHVDINSTFDSIAVIQSFIQREIEGQLRQMFREDLPGIIHRLSQQWVKAKVEAPYQTLPKQPQPVRAGFQQPQQQKPSVSKKPSLTSLNSRRPRASSHSSSTRPTFPSSASSSFSTAPSSPGASVNGNYNTNEGDSSPTPSSHPELENFDPTYGLRPEGLPTKSGFKAFSSLFTPNKGLADLAEENRSQIDGEFGYEDEEGEDDDEQYDDEEDSNSFDIVGWDDRHSLNFSSKENQQPPSTEYETIPAVGGGTITRPRVYHSQSAILSSSSLSSTSTSAGPSASPRRTHSSNGYNPYLPEGAPIHPTSATSLLPSALPHAHSHMLQRPATPGAGPSTLRHPYTNSRLSSSSHLNPNAVSGEPAYAYAYPYDYSQSEQPGLIGRTGLRGASENFETESSTDSGSYFSARAPSSITNGKRKEGSPSAIYMRRTGTASTQGNGYGYATPPTLPPYVNGYHPSPSPGRSRRMSVTSDATVDSNATMRTRTGVSSNYEDDVDDFDDDEEDRFGRYGYGSRPSSPPFSQSPPNSSYSSSRGGGPASLNSSNQKGHRQRSQHQQNGRPHNPNQQQHHNPSSSSSTNHSRPFKLNLAAASIHQLSSLSTSNHTLSPYTRDLSHFTVRSVPPRSLSMSGSVSTNGTRDGGTGTDSSAASVAGAGGGAGIAGRMHVGLGGLGYGPGRRFGYGKGVQERLPAPVKARRKRTFRIGGAGTKLSGANAIDNGVQGGSNNNSGNVNNNAGASAGKKKMPMPMKMNAMGEMDFDVSDMDRYFTHEQELVEEGATQNGNSNNNTASQSRQSTIRHSSGRPARPGLPAGLAGLGAPLSSSSLSAGIGDDTVVGGGALEATSGAM